MEKRKFLSKKGHERKQKSTDSVICYPVKQRFSLPRAFVGIFVYKLCTSTLKTLFSHKYVVEARFERFLA